MRRGSCVLQGRLLHGGSYLRQEEGGSYAAELDTKGAALDASCLGGTKRVTLDTSWVCGVVSRVTPLVIFRRGSAGAPGLGGSLFLARWRGQAAAVGTLCLGMSFV